jgi:tRNA-binding EMAP/Myf-like protein
MDKQSRNHATALREAMQQMADELRVTLNETAHIHRDARKALRMVTVELERLKQPQGVAVARQWVQ